MAKHENITDEAEHFVLFVVLIFLLNNNIYFFLLRITFVNFHVILSLIDVNIEQESANDNVLSNMLFFGYNVPNVNLAASNVNVCLTLDV